MKIEREKFDETIVTLDTYNSDLNLNISELRCSACPLTNEGFAFMWAGARATHGASRGKFCFEVKVLNHIFVPHLPCDEPNPHVLRVGFSIESSSLQLGEDSLSYGYDGTGKISTNCQFKDYGQCFTTGDVIMGVVNMNSDVTLIGFVKNGTFLGWAYEVPKYELNGQALFPHVLAKNVSFDVNFGQKVKSYFPLPSILKDYVFIGCIPLGQRQSGTQAPKEKRYCEMIMMCGLPGAGKSVWAANYSKKIPEKKFNVLGTRNIIDKMKIMGSPRKRNFTGSWDALIQMSTKCLNKMFEIGSNLKRNFILDQTNVYPTVQRRKMQSFEGFQRKAVVVIPPETEYYRRCDKRNCEEGIEVPDHVVLEMKANFKLPEVNDIFNEVIYAELPQARAQILVSDFNEAGKNAADCRPRKQFKPKNQSSKYDIGRRFDSGENRVMPAQGAYLSNGANESDCGGYEVGTIGLRGNFGSFGGSGGGLGGFGLNQGDFDANPSRLEESLGSFKGSQGGNGRKQSTFGNYGGFEDNRGGFDDSLRGKMGFNSNRKGFDGNHRGFGSNRGSFDGNHKDFASNHGVFGSKHVDFYGRRGVFYGNRDLVSNHESLDRIRGGHNGRGSRGGYRSKRVGFSRNRGGFIKNKSVSEGDKDLIKNCDAKGCTGLNRNRRFDIFSSLNRSKSNESSPGRYSGKNKGGYEGNKDLINNSDANDLGCTGLGRKRRFDIFSSLNTSKDNESSSRYRGRNESGYEGDKDLINNCDANDLGCADLGRKIIFDIFSRLNTSNDNEGFLGRYSGSSDNNYPPLSKSFSSKFETNSRSFGFNSRGDFNRSSGKQDSFGIDNDISGQLSSSNIRRETRRGAYRKSTCTNRSGLDFQVASPNVPFKSSQTGNDIFNKKEYGSNDFSWDTISTNCAYDESHREYEEISPGEFRRETKNYTRRETDNYAREETSYVSFPLGGIKKESGTESASSGFTMRRTRASRRITRWSAEIPPSSDNPESLSSSQEKNSSSSYLVKIKTEPLDDVISGYDTYRDNSSCTSYVPPSQSNRGMQSYGYTSSAVSSQQQAGDQLSTINSSVVLASQDQQGSQSVPKQLHPNQYYGQPTSENPPSYESTYGSK